ncbi:hypothetical protein [Enhygromyxa salina]|uniref:hypothetical protein n=1 Tax=Enhygromyxa salina TaxID=215803 RepID=UPI0011B1D157|nr:hypothetical protein [Enhygromyxa salina]
MSGSITGKVSALAGIFSKEFYAQVSSTGFDIPLPLSPLDKKDGDGGGDGGGGGGGGGGGEDEGGGSSGVDVSGRIRLDGDKLSVTINVDVGLPVEYMGVSLTPVCSFEEVTTFTLANPSVTKKFSVSLEVFGIAISIGPIDSPLSVPPSADGIKSLLSSCDELLSAIYSAIAAYLLAWAGELVDMGSTVANYVADFGGQIVDTIEELIFGGGSGGPPPPFLVNACTCKGRLDPLMFQWGQAISTSDGDQAFNFAEPFGGPCWTAQVSAARPNVRSSLSVGARAAQNFVLNRDNAIDYHIPMHWVALGPAPGSSGASAGYHDVGDVRIQWGQGVSTSDGDQSFALPGGFGSGPVSVVVNTDEAGIRSALALASINAAQGSFVLNRDNDVDGAIDFTFLAIGPAPGKTLSEGLLRANNLVLQWGEANSTSDGEELFELPTRFASMNFSVVSSFVKANVKSSLSISRAIHEGCFIVNRDGAIDGAVPFTWIAVGW